MRFENVDFRVELKDGKIESNKGWELDPVLKEDGSVELPLSLQVGGVKPTPEHPNPGGNVFDWKNGILPSLWVTGALRNKEGEILVNTTFHNNYIEKVLSHGKVIIHSYVYNVPTNFVCQLQIEICVLKESMKLVDVFGLIKDFFSGDLIDPRCVCTVINPETKKEYKFVVMFNDTPTNIFQTIITELQYVPTRIG